MAEMTGQTVQKRLHFLLRHIPGVLLHDHHGTIANGFQPRLISDGRSHLEVPVWFGKALLRKAITSG